MADPIFAAIERHKAARAAFEAITDRTDSERRRGNPSAIGRGFPARRTAAGIESSRLVLAKEQGREVTDADKAAYEAADYAEYVALADLTATSPQTRAGMRAAIAYFIKFDEGCMKDSSGRFLAALLASPARAG